MIPEDVLQTLNSFTKQNEMKIIAIDGKSCSGKTTLAVKLQALFDCHVFHIDDYFLPKQMRTASRLSEIGGHIHFERFKEDIIVPLQKKKLVPCRSYSCVNETFSDIEWKEPKNINIIEGAYSVHPIFESVYHYSIFMTVDEQAQLKRVMCREGKKRAELFLKKWIPKEEQYFNTYGIPSRCDVIIDTTTN